ncbi:MAG: type II toxin-antitoxin system Phd/YefM family antitoxin [Deltaproteobacteria bacterium]|nr:type II toxin-antitoxin system Phd/YefM family antitoxin [Deltaproteobacteria bacterium]
MEKTFSLSDAKAKLNSLIDEIDAKDDEFVITKNGRPVAALVPAALYEGWKETRAIQADPALMKQIQRGLKRLRGKKRRYTFDEVFGEPLK